MPHEEPGQGQRAPGAAAAGVRASRDQARTDLACEPDAGPPNPSARLEPTASFFRFAQRLYNVNLWLAFMKAKGNKNEGRSYLFCFLF